MCSDMEDTSRSREVEERVAPSPARGRGAVWDVNTAAVVAVAARRQARA